MSQMSHASAFIIDAYLRLDEGPGGFALAVEPTQPEAESHLGILAWSVGWASRAVDLLDKDHHYRSQLQKLERDLHISSVLKPSAVTRQSGRARRP